MNPLEILKDVRKYYKRRIKYHELLEQNKEILNNNIELKDRHKNERCFIIATGPSLKIEDIELLSEEVTFGVNSIYKVFSKTDWRPTYFCMTDYSVYTSLQEELSKIHFQSVISRYNMNFNTEEHYKVLINSITRVFRENRFLSKFKRLFPWTRFSTDITKYVYSGDTVVYNMIQVAAYMGFKEIYLLGADTSFRTDTVHSKIAEYDLKDDKKVALRGSAAERMIKSYEICAKKAKKMGFKVINVTRGGDLEVFPRKSLEEVLKVNK